MKLVADVCKCGVTAPFRAVYEAHYQDQQPSFCISTRVRDHTAAAEWGSYLQLVGQLIGEKRSIQSAGTS